MKTETTQIDAYENILDRKQGKLLLSIEIDPHTEDHPCISVYFPDNLFMYADLKSLESFKREDFSSKTVNKIDEIVEELERTTNHDFALYIKTLQERLKKASSEIQSIPEVKGKKFGL